MKSTLLTTALQAAMVLTIDAFAEPKDSGEVEKPTGAVAVLRSTKGHTAYGIVQLKQEEGYVHVTGRIQGLEPGEHGFHIHEYGDLRAVDGSSAGGHYDPRGHKHGAPDAAEHHAGDLGNVVANDDRVAVVDKKAEGLKLHFVIGRSIVVHAGADDFTSQPSGDSGARAAVGVIGFSKLEAVPGKKKIPAAKLDIE